MVATTTTPAVRTAPNLVVECMPIAELEVLVADAAAEESELRMEVADACTPDATEDAPDASEESAEDADAVISDATDDAEDAAEESADEALSVAEEMAEDADDMAEVAPETTEVDGRITTVVEEPMETEGWGPGTSGVPIWNSPELEVVPSETTADSVVRFGKTKG